MIRVESLALLVLLLRRFHSSESSVEIVQRQLYELERATETYVAARKKLDTIIQNSLQNIEETKIEIENANEELVNTASEVESAIVDFNTAQIEKLVEKLDEIEEKEIIRREGYENPASEASDIPDAILMSFFDPESVLYESETQLENWFVGLLSKEAENITTSITTQLSHGEAPLPLAERDECISVNTAAEEVMSLLVKLTQDGTGLYDHVQEGTIVHEHTSETFAPSPVPQLTLGGVWWGRFVPEDWEKLLPGGWQLWNVGLPPFLAHTFGLNQGIGVAPPEVILDPTVLPGACWPLRGGAGFVTIRLPYPVEISSISIEHASHILLKELGETYYTSAPRKIKAYGLPTCGEGCNGIGFDKRSAALIAEFEFNPRDPGILTVAVSNKSPDGTCTASGVSVGACSAPPSKFETFAGVEFVVENNWGNVDYTCLYRLRVHGEAKIPSLLVST
jgi:hypothetical protein